MGLASLKTMVLSSGVSIAFRPSLSGVSLYGPLYSPFGSSDVLAGSRTAGEHVLREDALDAVLDVLGGDRRAVLELEPVAQRERVGLAVRR